MNLLAKNGKFPKRISLLNLSDNLVETLVMIEVVIEQAEQESKIPQ